MTRHIMSLYYDNIDPLLVKNQALAMEALGYPVTQVLNPNIQHFNWILETLDRLPENDSVLFLDIDCIALTKEIVEEAFAAAEAGKMFGAGQAAEHLTNDFIYAGPMFLALSKSTWNKLDYASFPHKEEYDVAGAFTELAYQKGIEVVIKYPNFCFLPLWVLKGLYPFGIGTFYEGQIFHLFRARKNSGYQFIFNAVSEAIIANKAIDYLAIDRDMRSFKRKLAFLHIRLVKNFNRYIMRK